MRWVGFVVAVIMGSLISLWVLSGYLDPVETGVLVASILGLVIAAVIWSAATGTPASRWAAWRGEWADVTTHQGVVSVAMFVLGATGWVAYRMVETMPVLPVVFLAASVGFMTSFADRRVPALLVGGVAVYGVLSVVGPGLTAGEPVGVEEAIVGGFVLLATAVVALVISGPVYRWPMIAVASLAAGYVWSAFAVVQFYPFSVPFRRVVIAAVLGAGIVALLLSLSTRYLASGTDEVSGARR